MYKKFLARLALAVNLFATPAIAETPPQLPTPSKDGYADVNGVKVYYAVYGKGEPLVLLHGGFGLIEMFGPALSKLAENHTVIGVDLQAHGRTLPFDRPMSFEAMATDVAELITQLGYKNADTVGYSMGGGVALRMAMDHPAVVDKLVLVSTPFAFSGWHDSNANSMRGMAFAVDQVTEGMKQTPMYQAYTGVAPEPANWGKLVGQMAAFIGQDFDWSKDVAKVKSPTLLAVGDWDSLRLSHTTQFFSLLGSGNEAAGWDRSGMTAHRMAVLPNKTHYDIFASPELAQTVVDFLDAK